MKPLGSGNYATVCKVQVDGTGEVCALKIYKASKPAEMFRDKFEAEVRNMKRLSNRHISEFFGAYVYHRPTHTPEYGILMQPMANGGTLQDLIFGCRGWPRKTCKKQRDILLKSFGCLSSALAFIHKIRMRHKDVKPSNILIHNGTVLLADFGSSFDGFCAGNFAGDLTTDTPNPKGHTPRYSAPEVNTRNPRNAKSDVFSLGGVFYEIICSLEPNAEWYEDNYHCIVDDLRKTIVNWTRSFPIVIPLISRMLDSARDRRPAAADLVTALSFYHFCAECRQEHCKIESSA